MNIPAPTTAAAPSGRAYRFGRRATRGVLLGLSGPRLTALAVGFLVLLPAVFLGGAAGVAWTAPVWGLAAASALVPVGGRHLADHVGVQAHWLARRAAGQTVYGAAILRPRPAGTLALPGDAAALRLHLDTVTGAAMVHDPHARTLTAVASISHDSFLLLAPAEQDRRVAGWARVLASCCASGQIARIQILDRTVPDTSDRTQPLTTSQTGGWAAAQYRQLLAAAAPAAETHHTTMSVSLDVTASRRAVRAEGGGIPGAATVLRRQMTTLTAAVRSAELTLTRWADPPALARMLRTAYDPAATHLDDSNVGADLATAGPVWVAEHADHLVSDSGVHTVYWIAQWPRTPVPASFLSPLLLAPGLRRTFTLIAQSLTTTQAVRAVRRERVEYQTDAEHRARLGALPDLSAEAEWADVTAREHDLIAGHGDLRYAGLLVVTAASIAQLQADRAALEQAALQAGCETRILTGQQAQAFAAAALPLARGI